MASKLTQNTGRAAGTVINLKVRQELSQCETYRQKRRKLSLFLWHLDRFVTLRFDLWTFDGVNLVAQLMNYGFNEEVYFF